MRSSSEIFRSAVAEAREAIARAAELDEAVGRAAQAIVGLPNERP